MNNTNEELFQDCFVFNSKYQVLTKVHSCTFVTILIIPTILLNGVSILKIMKCSQLKEKIAYFLIMVQSLADLAVGFVTLPLFSYVFITQTLGNADCFRQRLILIIMNIPFSISLTILTAMTVDRYMHEHSTSCQTSSHGDKKEA